MKYTILLANGRIIDPASGVDFIGDLGILGDRIVESDRRLDRGSAEQVVDVGGKWIVPGVIDPHVHVSSWIGDYPGLSMMAKEGVITALDMAGPPESVFRNIREHGSGMNIACLDAFATGENKVEAEITDKEMEARIRKSVAEGAFGIKLLGGHYPLSPDLTRRAIRMAAKLGVYIAFHAGTAANGSNLNGMTEAVELADGHPLHLAHINSYCRGYVKAPLREVADAMELLDRSPNVWSESYLSVFNGTSGKCSGDELLSEVSKTCCRIKGFSPNRKGLAEAIKAGYARVVRLQGGENVLVTGEEGFRYWKELDTDVTLSFPVNNPEAQLGVALSKDTTGGFIVNSLSTDGGGIPRNSMVRQGLDLVKYGAFTPAEFVLKTSTNAAAMMGLKSKGRLSSGTDGDVTVVDPEKGRATMGIAGGRIIMVDGVVIGDGGTILTTVSGEDAARRSGLPYALVDIREALRNKKAAGAVE